MSLHHSTDAFLLQLSRGTSRAFAGTSALNVARSLSIGHGAVMEVFEELCGQGYGKMNSNVQLNQISSDPATRGRIPADVRGASMAVVAAHGQLTSDKRFIHNIADEEDLNESAVSLARAVAKVELVILFICSGGRVDPHPIVNTTVSLPKMLLDRGCRTVIASPWPLDVAVPSNWLERFLERWNSGDTALERTSKRTSTSSSDSVLNPGCAWR